jgi:hypothetical protein
MSSILDALKKVEQNSNSPYKGSVPAAALTNTVEQQEVHVPARQSNRTNWPVWVLMFVVVSIGSIVVYDHLITRDPVLPSSSTSQEVDKTVQPASTVPPGRETERIIPEKKSTDTVQEVARQSVETSGLLSTATQVPVKEEPGQTAASLHVDQPAEKEVSLVEQEKDVQISNIIQTNGTIHDEQADIPAQTEPAGEETAISHARQAVVQEGLPVLEPGILKLQAITWSPAAEKRFIVVNNTISRTRDVVNGYIISRINIDSVVVRQKDSDQEWLVEFRTR